MKKSGEHEEPGRNEPCVCGADRKYKRCCHRVIKERQLGPQHYQHLSIKSIVLEEISSFKETFGIELKEDRLKVSGHITDSDVVFFVERVRNLWGSKPDLTALMPDGGDLRFRALYFGNPDILDTINLLARYSLYCDQIVVIDPLSVFHRMRRNFAHSPFAEPQAWIRQIIRDGVYLCSLEEWIKNDLVFATAFPLSDHDPLRQRHVQDMKSRLQHVSPERWNEIVHDTVEAQFYSRFTPAELAAMEPSEADMALLKSVEDDKWWARHSPHMRKITRENAVDTLKSMRRRKEDIGRTIARLRQDPRRWEWTLKREFESRMDVFGSGMNLADAEWLAGVTGSHLVTDRRAVWNEILSDELPEDQERTASDKMKLTLSALGEAFQKLEFYFLNDVPLDFVLQMRRENRLTRFRTYLRDFWNSIRRNDLEEGQRLAVIQEFRDSLDTQYQQFKSEFAEIRKSVLGRIAIAGASGAGAILTGQLALWLFSLGSLASALPEEAKRQTKQSQALSVFLDLERR
jgi:hypothetical protein